jgi:hypothetical protein
LWLADGRDAVLGGPTNWRFYNLAQEHNNLLGNRNPSMLYPAPELAVVNASSKPSYPALTKAYTGLETVGCDEYETTACMVVVSYDRLANGNSGPDPPGPNGSVDAAFTMRVTVKAVIGK